MARELLEDVRLFTPARDADGFGLPEIWRHHLPGHTDRFSAIGTRSPFARLVKIRTQRRQVLYHL